MDNYRTSGVIINGMNDIFKGIGNADIIIMDKIAVVTFTAKITEPGVAEFSNFNNGLNSELICSASGAPKITPITGGSLMYLNSEGKLISELYGYGGCFQSNGNFWGFARVYTIDGVIGMWASRSIPQNTVLVGTAYGKLG